MAGEKTHLLVIDRPFYGAEEGTIVQGLLIASLFISLLVLCVRITEVRTLLLTIVFSGVLSLALGMVSVFFLMPICFFYLLFGCMWQFLLLLYC